MDEQIFMTRVAEQAERFEDMINFLEKVILLRIWLVLLFAFINSILQLQDMHIFAEVNQIINDCLMFLLLFFISSSFFEMGFWFRNSFHNFGLVW